MPAPQKSAWTSSIGVFAQKKKSHYPAVGDGLSMEGEGDALEVLRIDSGLVDRLALFDV